MLQMSLGRADSARPHLEQVDELGSRYGNNWLQASARTQLAALAVGAGELGAARALLGRAVDAIDATHLSTLTLTFALVTAAQLAQADGDPRRAATLLGAAHGLRPRAGLTAWPLTRRREGQLVALVADDIDPATYEAAFGAGAELNARAALDLVRGDRCDDLDLGAEHGAVGQLQAVAAPELAGVVPVGGTLRVEQAHAAERDRHQLGAVHGLPARLLAEASGDPATSEAAGRRERLAVVRGDHAQQLVLHLPRDVAA